MAAEEKPAPRGTIATVVATAAVTLAIGVTVAGLGGYLAPAGGDQPKPLAVAAPAPPTTIPAPESSPSVVLVPITPELRAEMPRTSAARPDTEVLLAAYEPAEHDGEDDDDDHHRDRGHHERDDEHDHDDD